MVDVAYPWLLDKEDKEDWAVNEIHNLELPVWTKPVPELLSQVETLVRYAQGKRNWMVLYSTSIDYMRSKIYPYLLATWIASTGRRGRIIDVEVLVEAAKYADSWQRDSFINVDLLIVPAFDPSYQLFRENIGIIAMLFQKRRLRKYPTFLELYIPAKSLRPNFVAVNFKLLAQIYGEVVADLFSPRQDFTRHVGVKTRKEAVYE